MASVARGQGAVEDGIAQREGSHTLYPEIAPIVRAACARHGVTYAVAPRLRDALGSHVRHLKAMGARGEAPDLELG